MTKLIGILVPNGEIAGKVSSTKMGTRSANFQVFAMFATCFKKGREYKKKCLMQ